MPTHSNVHLHTMSKTPERLHQQVCSFLSDPKTYGSRQKTIEVTKTHGALIFLGPDHVYKIKRPVKYDYMDFSTLAKRKVVCQRELKINQPFAPSIYIDVVAITMENDDSLAINGKGKPVEWAVKMHRFAQKDVLNRMAERGELDNDLAARLGKQISEFHNGLEVQKTSDGALRIFEILEQLDRGLGKLGHIIPAADTQKFNTKSRKSFKEIKPVLDARAHSGMIRRCHADLHLGNIVLIDGVPTLFDALEFDERLATNDVIYDIAFLIMDMLHQGLNRQANTVLNRYLLNAWPLVSGSGLRILPLFLGLRAAIRAMVSAQAAERDPAAWIKKADEARTYFSHASDFLNTARPVLLAVGGLSGTGKSTLAAELAPKLGSQPGAILLRSDVERKHLAGIDEHSKLPAQSYTAESSNLVYNRLLEKADDILSQGHSVILDAVFALHQERQAAFNIATAHNAPFCGLWLHARQDVLLARVSNRKPDASDANIEIVKKQLAIFSETFSNGSPGWIKIDASNSPSQTLQTANKKLRQHLFSDGRF